MANVEMNVALDGSAHGLTLNPSVWFFAGQIDESEPVRQVQVRCSPFIVGRKSGLDLTLPCNCVSKEHAELFARGNTLWIRDLQSTNGTFVNGQKIEDDVMLREGDIVQFATVVFRVGRDAAQSTEGGTLQADAGDRALTMVQFDRLIHDEAVVPFYQPIIHVDRDDRQIVGFEVLGRSRLFGLRTPQQMFEAASHLKMEAQLSRIFRRRGVQVAEELPPTANLFVNTHPVELTEDGLTESLEELRTIHPDQPMTLEIHEAAVTNPAMIRELRETLQRLNMGLAFDDFGAGQARLIELSEVRPDYLKFDMKLVQGICQAPIRRQQVLAYLVKMVNELGIAPLAEGVETEDDHETLREMGFVLGQGYLYGRPSAVSVYRQP